MPENPPNRNPRLKPDGRVAKTGRDIISKMDARAIKRFEAKFSARGECIEWNGAKDGNGYGMFSLYGKYGAPEKAHRISYTIYIGVIPIGLVVCHKCDNPACVKPDHLFIGTQQDNLADAYQKGHMQGPKSPLKGEALSHAKLKAFDIPTIWSMISSGASFTETGRQFGVGRSAIARIWHRKQWKTQTEDLRKP